MTLETFIQVAQLAGVLAVITSVIFLAKETRLASESRRLDAHAIAAQQMIGVISDLKRDPVLMEIYSRGLSNFDALNSEEKWRFGAMMQEFMYAFRTAWLFGPDRNPRTSGDEDLMGYIRAICCRPGFQAWWPAGKSTVPQDFANYIDEISNLNQHEGVPKFGFPEKTETTLPGEE